MTATPTCRCTKCKRRRAYVRAQRASVKLLLAHLTPAQRAEWHDGKYFTVRTPSGRVFRLENRHCSNVIFVSGRKTRWWMPGQVLCVGIEQPVPTPDLLLAQKLLLEARGGETHLLRIAA